MDVDTEKPISEISDGVDGIFISARSKRLRQNIPPVGDVREDYKRRTLPPLLASDSPNLPPNIPPIDPSSRVSNSILRHQTPFNISPAVLSTPSSSTTSPPQLPISPNLLFYPPPALDLNQINSCDRKIYESPYNSCLPSLEPLDCIKKEKYCGPTDESNWLIQDHLMIGAFPADISNHITYHNLGNIMRLGIGTFICLQQEYDPDPNITTEQWKNGKKLRPYFRDVKRIYKDGSLWSLPSHIKPKSIDFIHFPIVDLTTSANDSELFFLCKEIIKRLENEEKIYIHCWGGHGRAGMVGSIIIGLCYNLKPQEAMERVQKCHDLRKCNLNVSSPQTTEQRLQVARILLSPLARQYILERFNPEKERSLSARKQRELPSNSSSPRSTYSSLSPRFSNNSSNNNNLVYTPMPPSNSSNNPVTYRRYGVRYSSNNNQQQQQQQPVPPPYPYSSSSSQQQPPPPPPPPPHPGNKRIQSHNYNFRQNQYTNSTPRQQYQYEMS